MKDIRAIVHNVKKCAISRGLQRVMESVVECLNVICDHASINQPYAAKV